MEAYEIERIAVVQTDDMTYCSSYYLDEEKYITDMLQMLFAAYSLDEKVSLPVVISLDGRYLISKSDLDKVSDTLILSPILLIAKAFHVNLNLLYEDDEKLIFEETTEVL